MPWAATIAVAALASSTDATSYSTASYTPAADRLMRATVESTGSVPPATPTMSGNGLTWLEENTASNSSRRLTTFLAKSGASPATGAVTAAFGAETQTGCSILVEEIDGADLSGTALDAVVQTKADGAGSGATSGSITLDAAPAAANRCFSSWTHTANEGTTERAGWTEIQQAGHSAPVRAIQSQWRSDAAEQTGSASWATSSGWNGIVTEFKAAGAGGQHTRDFAGSSASSGALAQTTAKTTGGGSSPAGALLRAVTKPLVGAATPAGALSAVWSVLRTFAGSSTPAGTLARTTTIPRGGTSTPTGTLARSTTRLLTAVSTPAGALARSIAKLLTGTSSSGGAVETTLGVLRRLHWALGLPRRRWSGGLPRRRRWSVGSPRR